MQADNSNTQVSAEETITAETENKTNEKPISPDTPNPQPSLKSKLKKKHSKKFYATIILIIILILTGAGVGIYSLLNPSIQKSEISNNTPETIEKASKIARADLALIGNSLSDFDLEFLKAENTEKNKIYSPLSIKYALAMLSDAASGETKSQIDQLLGSYHSKKYTDSEHLSLANAFAVRDIKKDAIKTSYVDTISSKYNASIIYDPFENAATINNWVNNKTFGLINNLVSDNTVREEDNDFILINALAIDMNWNHKIQYQQDDSTVPQKAYFSVRFPHEKYSAGIASITNNAYPPMTFNNQENTKSVEIGATANRYDIINKLGEDTIRSTVKAALEKWLAGGKCETEGCIDATPLNQRQVWLAEYAGGTVDDYLNKYMEDLKGNYKFLKDSTDFAFYDDDNVKVFAKDLQSDNGTTLRYAGIMPKTTELSKYIKNLSAENLNSILANVKDTSSLDNFQDGVITKITGHIPLFHFDYNLDLKNDLEILGIKDVFDKDKSDLSNLASTTAWVNDAIHSANIDFSNYGIKAAAATAIFGGTGAGVPDFDYIWNVPIVEIDLTFDKPFLFLIYDKDSGEVWFSGTVYEAAKNL